jgi:serine/threonine protein kinase
VTEENCGPYRLERIIGRGGMGEVYRAFDTVRKRTVALKLLKPMLGSDPEYVARFRAEAAIAARLTEPHIPPVHDFGEIEGRLFIDMRLVEGVDLAVLLQRDGRAGPSTS